MDENQKLAIIDCMTQLTEELDVGQIALQLRTSNILTEEDFELINLQATSNASRKKLLDILQKRDKSWEALIAALNKNKQSYLGKLCQTKPLITNFNFRKKSKRFH